MEYFCGAPVKVDIYNGLSIDFVQSLTKNDSNAESNSISIQTMSVDHFDSLLKDSLCKWVEAGRKCVWIRVPSSLSHLVPALIKHKFEYHHTKPQSVMLIKWICENETNRVPNFAHTTVGVGGLVYDRKTNKVLLIQEKKARVQIWKFPGGYAEPGEDLAETAIREVFEETGLRCRFHSLITFRHRHDGIFGCSDFYFVCLLNPIDSDATLNACQIEIEACQWFDLDQANEHLCGFNKFVFEKFRQQYQQQLPTLTGEHTSDQCDTAKGQTINSKVIHSMYGHIGLTERVYSVEPVEQFP